MQGEQATNSSIYLPVGSTTESTYTTGYSIPSNRQNGFWNDEFILDRNTITCGDAQGIRIQKKYSNSISKDNKKPKNWANSLIINDFI